jgi:hypothetical protein
MIRRRAFLAGEAALAANAIAGQKIGDREAKTL